MAISERTRVLQEVIRVLCLDLACSESQLKEDGIVVTEFQERPGRRRFPVGRHHLSIATMGRGVVVSCDPSRLEWARCNLVPMDRDGIFSAHTIPVLNGWVKGEGQSIAGPDLKFVCTRASLRYYDGPGDIPVELIETASVQELYQVAGFHHALQYRADSPRPDVLACVAEDRGVVVGIAGASADCDTIWQIGVDVIPSHRGRGIGKALVSKLTRAVQDMGHIPYYSTVASNILSQALAASVGYWPAWVEMYAR